MSHAKRASQNGSRRGVAEANPLYEVFRQRCTKKRLPDVDGCYSCPQVGRARRVDAAMVSIQMDTTKMVGGDDL